MRTPVLVTIVAIAGALAAAGPVPAGAPCSVPLFAYHTGIVVLSEGGRVTRVRVQIADTPDRRQVGLMCRPALDPDAGMLFIPSQGGRSHRVDEMSDWDAIERGGNVLLGTLLALAA